MAVNRYDQPAQYNPIDTYVPLPFKELMSAIQYREGVGEQTTNAALKLGDLAVAETLDYVNDPIYGRRYVGDKSGSKEAKGFIEDINNRISELVSYEGDPSDPMYRRKIMKITNELQQAKSQQGILGKAEKTAADYKLLEESMRKAGSVQGSEWRARSIANELSRFQRDGGPLDTSLTVGSYVDRAKGSEQLVKGLEESVIKRVGLKPGVDEFGQPTYYQTGSERVEITEDQIRNTAKGLIWNSEVGTDLRNQRDTIADTYMYTNPDLSYAEAIKLADEEIQKSYKEIEDSLVAKFMTTKTANSLTFASGWRGINTGEFDPSLFSTIDDEIISNPDRFGVNKKYESEYAGERNRLVEEYRKKYGSSDLQSATQYADSILGSKENYKQNKKNQYPNFWNIQF